MRHVTDGTLRRLTDEPLAVADREARHMSNCARCRARGAESRATPPSRPAFSPAVSAFLTPTWPGPAIKVAYLGPVKIGRRCSPGGHIIGASWAPLPGPG